MVASVHGLVGCILFGAVFLHCCWQVSLLSAVETKHTKRWSHYLQIKLYFHVIFAWNCLLEVIFSFSLLLTGGRYVRWGYCCHLIGLYVNMMSFLLVLRLWNTVLAGQSLLPVRDLPYVVFLVLNFVSLMVDLSIYAIYGESEMGTVPTVLAVMANIVYILSLFIVSCVLFWYGVDLKRKLFVSSVNVSESLQTLLRRINFSLLIFCICYGIRIVGLALITFEMVDSSNDYGMSKVPYVVWIMMSFWIPTVCTGVIFLYIMHYRPSLPLDSGAVAGSSSEVPSNSSTSSQQSSRLISFNLEGEEFANPLLRDRMKFYSTDSLTC